VAPAVAARSEIRWWLIVTLVLLISLPMAALILLICRRRRQVEDSKNVAQTDVDWQTERVKGPEGKEDNIVVPF
jgi:hypothetical protein